MNKTIKEILQLCDSEDLDLTYFQYKPDGTITIELKVDDDAKCGPGKD